MKYNVTVDNLDQSTVTIKGELAAEDFAAFRTETIKELSAKTDLPGFRKGRAPENVLVSRLGEDKILWTMAEKAIQSLYSLIIEDKDLSVIGRPEVQITKLAAGNPLGFTIKTAIIPSLSLPDYRTIAEKVLADQRPPSEVVNQEIDEFIDNLWKMEVQGKAGDKIKDGDSADPAGKLPPVDTVFIKKFGDFKSVEEFREKIKQQLAADKKNKAREKTRVAILEAIAAEIEITPPEILVSHELDKMMAELKGQVEPLGVKFADYLIHLKKTEAELRQTWKADAEKRVKFGLLIQKIADDAKLAASETELKNYTDQLLARYPDQSKVNPANLQDYAANLIINEKVFSLLEKSGK